MTICIDWEISTHLGDFNSHLDNFKGKTKNSMTSSHSSILSSMLIYQLTPMVTKCISNSIKSVFSAAGTSYHMAVISEIDCCRTKLNKAKINKNDHESFHSDILNSYLIKKPEKDISALCQACDSVLSSMLDKHAPVSTKTLPRKPPTPWMTPEININATCVLEWWKS